MASRVGDGLNGFGLLAAVVHYEARTVIPTNPRWYMLARTRHQGGQHLAAPPWPMLIVAIKSSGEPVEIAARSSGNQPVAPELVDDVWAFVGQEPIHAGTRERRCNPLPSVSCRRSRIVGSSGTPAPRLPTDRWSIASGFAWPRGHLGPEP